MSAAQVALASKAFLSAGIVNSAMRPSREGQRIQAVALARLSRCGFIEDGASVRQIVWRCHRWLQRNYRNEHVYRTHVLHEMVLRERGALAIPEFRVNSSKADFLVVGGDLHAVEIKSDLDSADRLEAQLADYRQIAPRVSVVAPARIAHRLLDDPAWAPIGVSTLRADGAMELLRDAWPDDSGLSSEAMLRSMRRSEYLAALRSLGLNVALAPNTRIFARSLQMVAMIRPADLHAAMVAQLGARRPKAGMKAISRVPRPLRAIVLRIDPGQSQLDRLDRWLNSEVGDVSSKVEGASV